ncbi:MAG: trypsin-like peptidase domain-containing protein [Candidatus Doudnabacteria bacterium]|nr:trypsin-like peptidase domain-containing protein [Candidatus Doudnabacteria bacterium]
MWENIKNKWLITLGASLILGITVFNIARDTSKNQSASYQILSQEELAKLVKPAVVRIAQKVEGTYSIPEFEIDLNGLSTQIRSSRKPDFKQLNDYVTGSGFIISSDGYILTNAHVVSEEMIKAFLIREIFSEKLEEKLKGLSKEEQRNIFQDRDKTEKFAEDSLTLLLTNSRFNINSSLAVLNPASQKEKIENLFSGGFPAELINLNENFLSSNKDVALIKIQATNLPTINLGDESKTGVGSKISIFGFPAAAELNSLNPVEPTLTQGVISALKFSENKDFKILQTDAKVSQGSSGGPMFNGLGEVVGIITYQTNPIYQALGDNFAFAVPISLGKKLLEAQKVQTKKIPYQENLQKALRHFKEGRCKLANQEFIAAISITNGQFVKENYFEDYLKACQKTIAQGQSLDSKLDIILQKINSFNAFEWFVILGRAVLVMLGIILLMFLYKRLEKDEAEIKELETELNHASSLVINQKTGQPRLPLPEEELHAHERHALGITHPHLEGYVKEAKAVGLKDEQIKTELLRAGWQEVEVNTALKS